MFISARLPGVAFLRIEARTLGRGSECRQENGASTIAPVHSAGRSRGPFAYPTASRSEVFCSVCGLLGRRFAGAGTPLAGTKSDGIMLAAGLARPAIPGRKAMQYLVEAARGPLPPSPEQALALLEGTVIPHFEYMIRLKAEGKILAGGVPVGDRAFVCVIEAASNDEADRIVRDMPAWGLLEWKVSPLQSVEARAEMEQNVVQALKSARR